MAIMVQIVLKFESWTIVESTFVLHQMQGPFDFLLSWGCGSCNSNVQTKNSKYTRKHNLDFFSFSVIFFLYFKCGEANTRKWQHSKELGFHKPP
jgi:hypothetical protein